MVNLSSSGYSRPQKNRVNIIWINGVSEEKDVEKVEFISHGAILELVLSDNVHEYVPIIQVMKLTVTKY